MRKLIYFLTTLCLVSITTIALAKDKITLYAKPNEKSAVVEKVKATDKLVKIIEKGKWIEVGNTENGKIGWIQKDKFTENDELKLFTTTFSKKDKNGNQTIHYTGTVKLNKQQIKEMINRMKEQQMQMQKSMNKMFEDNMRDFNQFMQNFWDDNKIEMREISAPVSQAIIIVPEKQQTKAKKGSEKGWWEKLKDTFK